MALLTQPAVLLAACALGLGWLAPKAVRAWRVWLDGLRTVAGLARDPYGFFAECRRSGRGVLRVVPGFMGRRTFMILDEDLIRQLYAAPPAVILSGPTLQWAQHHILTVGRRWAERADWYQTYEPIVYKMFSTSGAEVYGDRFRHAFDAQIDALVDRVGAAGSVEVALEHELVTGILECSAPPRSRVAPLHPSAR